VDDDPPLLGEPPLFADPPLLGEPPLFVDPPLLRAPPVLREPPTLVEPPTSPESPESRPPLAAVSRLESLLEPHPVSAARAATATQTPEAREAIAAA
jgi:hypothetical protein